MTVRLGFLDDSVALFHSTLWQNWSVKPPSLRDSLEHSRPAIPRLRPQRALHVEERLDQHGVRLARALFPFRKTKAFGGSRRLWVCARE